MSMEPSSAAPDRRPLLEVTGRPDFDASVNSIVRRIASTSSEPEVIDLLGMASRRLGADNACLMSFIQEDERRGAYRYLLACDPRWSNAYLQHQWFAVDPWLLHAMKSVQVVRASELKPETPEQQAMIDAARVTGFCSAVIVPAPIVRFEARTAALYLGSTSEGYFDGDAFTAVKVLARGLAMELAAWLSKKIREEWVAHCRLTEEDIALLRFEQQGYGSKAIATALQTEAKTIDCRFQRVNAKLGTASRKASLRLARLYELL